MKKIENRDWKENVFLINKLREISSLIFIDVIDILTDSNYLTI